MQLLVAAVLVASVALAFVPAQSDALRFADPPAVSFNYSATVFISIGPSPSNLTGMGTLVWKNNHALRAAYTIGTVGNDPPTSLNHHLNIYTSSTAFDFNPTSQACGSANCLDGKCCNSPSEGVCACLLVGWIYPMWDMYKTASFSGQCEIGPSLQGLAWTTMTAIDETHSVNFTLCYSKILLAPAWVVLGVAVNGSAFFIRTDFSDWVGGDQPDELFQPPSYCQCNINGGDSREKEQDGLQTPRHGRKAPRSSSLPSSDEKKEKVLPSTNALPFPLGPLFYSPSQE